MSRRIPKAFISDLVARSDLLEVVGMRVQLKKAGSNYKGLCPFHDEKTPSFTVRPDKGFYKCFGCGAYGNAIDFLMEYENRPFPEAVEILADLLRLEIPYEGTPERTDGHEPLYAALAAADRLYRERLRDNPEAIGYLKSRGIDGETAARFGVGFAPDAWDTLAGPARNDAAKSEALLTAGLAVRSDGGRLYDRFRNRIMFPIRDTRGRVIGFGGRVLGNEEPKYLNSPDTPLFDKSRTLYGLYEARQQPGRPASVVVVEGYMDVIALMQNGISPAIATMGTATTADNTRQLTRLSERIVFCFDGDRAGRAAAGRALESVLPFGGGNVSIGFMLLPEGDDPDTLVRRDGADAFRAMTEAATPLSEFLIAEAGRDVDLRHADGKSLLVTRARPLVARLPRGVYRDLIVAQLAEVIGMTVAATETALDDQRAAPTAPPPRAAKKSTKMRRLLQTVVHFPRAAARVGPIDGLQELDLPGARLLADVLDYVTANPEVSTAVLTEAFRDDPEGRFLRDLAATESLETEEKAPDFIREGIGRLIAERQQARRAAALRDRDRKL